MATFGERLKMLRTHSRMTKKQMADKLNITERAYRRYEDNDSTPRHGNLIALAAFFDCSIDFLVGRTNNPLSHKINPSPCPDSRAFANYIAGLATRRVAS